MAELPYFLYFLQNWTIPAELVCPRFRIKHFHHPELLAALESTAPEYRLLTLINQLLMSDRNYCDGRGFQGTAERLEQQLRQVDALRYQVDRLLSYSAACGAYLGRLAGKTGSRVASRKVNGTTVWTINPPELPAAEQASGPVPLPTNPLIAGLKNTTSPSLQGGGVEQVYHNSMSIDVNWKDAEWNVHLFVGLLTKLAPPLHPDV
jgi:hypothetical protein